jgi:phage shock protein PspC (stress-responsive transcriptional regulator)
MNATSENATRNDSAATGSTRGSAGAQSLCRPTDDRIVAGVAAGVARTLGIDPLIVRIGFVVLALLGAAGLPLYLAGWLLIPDERSGRSIAADLSQSLSARNS